MRLLLVLTIIAMAMGLLAFSMNNLGTTVSVTLLNTTTQMRLWEVVGIAVLMGVVATAVIAVTEGTTTRLSNRRLRREVHKLETELNFARTQPSLRKPATATVTKSPNLPDASGKKPGRPPSAPVYDTNPGDSPISDDEPYTGGRAV